MDERILVPILPIFGFLAVRITDIRTRHIEKNTETDGRTRWYKKCNGRTRTAFRNSVAISTWDTARCRRTARPQAGFGAQKRRLREANGKGRHVEDRRTTAMYAIHAAVAVRKEKSTGGRLESSFSDILDVEDEKLPSDQ